MATTTLTATGDGTTTGWVRNPASGSLASALQSIAGSDGDTTRIEGPDGSNGSVFFDITDVPADFDPGAINSITIRILHRRVNTPQMAVDDGTVTCALVRSDETTAISTTPTAVNTPIQAGYAQTNFTPSPTGSHTVADWNAARVRIDYINSNNQTPDTVNQMYVTALEIEVDYTPSLPGWFPMHRRTSPTAAERLRR